MPLKEDRVSNEQNDAPDMYAYVQILMSHERAHLEEKRGHT